jgi:hypothetical protein
MLVLLSKNWEKRILNWYARYLKCESKSLEKGSMRGNNWFSKKKWDKPGINSMRSAKAWNTKSIRFTRRSNNGRTNMTKKDAIVNVKLSNTPKRRQNSPQRRDNLSNSSKKCKQCTLRQKRPMLPPSIQSSIKIESWEVSKTFRCRIQSSPAAKRGIKIGKIMFPRSIGKVICKESTSNIRMKRKV